MTKLLPPSFILRRAIIECWHRRMNALSSSFAENWSDQGLDCVSSWSIISNNENVALASLFSLISQATDMTYDDNCISQYHYRGIHEAASHHSLALIMLDQAWRRRSLYEARKLILIIRFHFEYIDSSSLSMRSQPLTLPPTASPFSTKLADTLWQLTSSLENEWCWDEYALDKKSQRTPRHLLLITLV